MKLRNFVGRMRGMDRPTPFDDEVKEITGMTTFCLKRFAELVNSVNDIVAAVRSGELETEAGREELSAATATAKVRMLRRLQQQGPLAVVPPRAKS